MGVLKSFLKQICLPHLSEMVFFEELPWIKMIPSIVKNNPFRVLGCFANCTAKERISNKSRLSAFARVNKTCDFPGDMKEILGDVTRTPSSIAEAEQALNLPED